MQHWRKTPTIAAARRSSSGLGRNTLTRKLGSSRKRQYGRSASDDESRESYLQTLIIAHLFVTIYTFPYLR